MAGIWRGVLLAYCFGTSFVSVYGFRGPFAEQGMKELVEGEPLDTVKGRVYIGDSLFGVLPMPF